MATTLTKILMHIVFSTKNRSEQIPAERDDDLYSYMGGICRGTDSVLLAMGGTSNHVHMFVSQSKNISLSDLLLNIKRDSSKWMKQHVKDFRWQHGYFGLSIGESGAKALRAYIANQKAHHEKVDFKDEVRALCKKYGIELNERYAWE